MLFAFSWNISLLGPMFASDFAMYLIAIYFLCTLCPKTALSRSLCIESEVQDFVRSPSYTQLCLESSVQFRI